MEKTYLEILAENDAEARQEFDPNAKDLLVDNVLHYEHSVDGDDRHPDELEDQHEFQKEQPSHQQAALGREPGKNQITLVSSVTYQKNVFTQVLNVDSRFRENPTSSTTSEFLFRLPRPVKNVVSVRISSIELPNSFYSFSLLRGNTSFYVTYPSGSTTPYSTQLLVIPDDNYTILTLTATIQKNWRELNFGVPGGTPLCMTQIQVIPNTDITGIVVFKNGTGSTIETPFDINFAAGSQSNRTFSFGLGYNLGFRQTLYTRHVFLSGTAIADTIDSNYLFLTLDPDWKVVIHNTPDRTQLFSFAKIIMDVPKFAVLFDNGANTLTKEYWLKQPTNITSFPVRLSDPYDQTLDLNNVDFSFSLEIKECLNAALYETMRN